MQSLAQAHVANSATMRIVGLDHIQLAIPRNAEEQARAFYADVPGLEELPKPPELAGRGGVRFQCGGRQLHLGVEDDFHPAGKAHPGILIENIDALPQSLRMAGYELVVEALSSNFYTPRHILVHPQFW
jgi:catechol 2,3-dioxygenase-like lactoylglutathione lyase family enzyme